MFEQRSSGEEVSATVLAGGRARVEGFLAGLWD
jgi:hypothetical protein